MNLTNDEIDALIFLNFADLLQHIIYSCVFENSIGLIKYRNER